MSLRRRSPIPWFDFALRSFEIAQAAPEVVARRTRRMMDPATASSQEVREDTVQMVLEKPEAFQRGMQAMGEAQWRAMRQLWSRCPYPAAWSTKDWATWFAALNSAAQASGAAMNQSIEPIHERVHSNVRRLRKQDIAAAQRAARKRARS